VPDAPALERLPATRREILVVLRQRGEIRVGELAEAVGVTVSGARQHLTGLAEDGLVRHREIRGGPGRPKHAYALTRKAEDLFPRAYGELAREVLDSVADESPEMLDRIFERRRRRRVQRAQERLAGKGFGDRVAELARILDEDGYLADFEALADGAYRITEHNCAVFAVAQQYGGLCSAEISFIREVLPDADVERVAHMIAGAHICAYHVRPR
jgi:DeoR family transcriptional regulator, suf operon transcriptional repressor